MVTNFENFKLWFALSLGSPDAASATLFIDNSDNTELIYCIPISFQKRQTDTSNAQSEDPEKPDSGTAGAIIELRIMQPRNSPPTTPIVNKLLQMFYLKSDDSDFRKARFGLESDDAPGLNTVPGALNGYKFLNFKEEPNPDNPAKQIYTIQLEFLGDHTKLGAFP